MDKTIQKHQKVFKLADNPEGKAKLIALTEDLYHYHSVVRGRKDTELLLIEEQKWTELTNKYNKDEMAEGIMLFILHFKSKFPFKYISRRKMQDCYDGLKALPQSALFYIPEYTNGQRVVERHDYKYGFDTVADDKGRTYGLACLRFLKESNHASDYFMEGERYRCDTWSRKSGYHIWETGQGIRGVIKPIFRMYKKSELTFQEYAEGIRLGSYVASSFKPTAAKGMYELFNAKVIFDFSCGWGDRLAGFFGSTAKTYYGTDPNDKVYNIYWKQCLVYNSLDKMITIPTIEKEHELDYETIDYDKLKLHGNLELQEDYFTFVGDRKKVRIFNQGAEAFNTDLIDEPLDLIFTSPPYFDTEKYGTNSDKKENQSWNKFDSFESWKNDFLYATYARLWPKLKNGGIMAINITDVTKGKNTKKLCDDMVDWCIANLPECQFRGQIGMVLQLRPNTLNEKVATDELNKIKAIEPVWVFQKGTGEFTMNLHGTENVEDLFEE